jgi:hypothetical protein
MARLLGCAFVVGVAVWLACGPRVSAVVVDSGQPVAPGTACHSPMLTQNYSDCATKPWRPPLEAKGERMLSVRLGDLRRNGPK